MSKLNNSDFWWLVPPYISPAFPTSTCPVAVSLREVDRVSNPVWVGFATKISSVNKSSMRTLTSVRVQFCFGFLLSLQLVPPLPVLLPYIHHSCLKLPPSLILFSVPVFPSNHVSLPLFSTFVFPETSLQYPQPLLLFTKQYALYVVRANQKFKFQQHTSAA